MGAGFLLIRHDHSERLAQLYDEGHVRSYVDFVSGPWVHLAAFPTSDATSTRAAAALTCAEALDPATCELLYTASHGLLGTPSFWLPSPEEIVAFLRLQLERGTDHRRTMAEVKELGVGHGARLIGQPRSLLLEVGHSDEHELQDRIDAIADLPQVTHLEVGITTGALLRPTRGAGKAA